MAINIEQNNLPPAKHKEISSATIILIDVLVAVDGSVLKAQLSQPKRYTSFNRFALMKAKKDHYPIKLINGVATEYWNKNIPITISIKAL